MFDNIGGKIKAWAQAVCWVGIIASVICGIIIMAIGERGFNLIGFLIMIFGALFSWIGSFMTYGFGQLVENTDRLVCTKINNSTSPIEKKETAVDKMSMLNKWKEEGLITEGEYNQKMEDLK